MESEHSGRNQLDSNFEEERRKTAECLADVQQFLSHDTSPTRRQLIEALRLRIEVIEADLGPGNSISASFTGESRRVLESLADQTGKPIDDLLAIAVGLLEIAINASGQRRRVVVTTRGYWPIKEFSLMR